MPTDLQQYHEVLWENKPDTVIEIGTKYGGSSLFLQDTLDLIGAGGKVVTVDILDQKEKADPRITYLLGDSKRIETVEKIKALARGKVMLILDGNHSRRHVKWELHRYASLVTPGQYLVLEDCYSKEGFLYGPGQARDWFLLKTKDFEQTNLERNFLVGFNYGGWLRRK
jgi:cephalosporin hydroxylase